MEHLAHTMNCMLRHRNVRNFIDVSSSGWTAAAGIARALRKCHPAPCVAVCPLAMPSRHLARRPSCPRARLPPFHLALALYCPPARLPVCSPAHAGIPVDRANLPIPSQVGSIPHFSRQGSQPLVGLSILHRFYVPHVLNTLCMFHEGVHRASRAADLGAARSPAT